MITIDRIRELVQLGNENRNLDFKGAFSWDDASNDQKCEITKDVLAFANTRDGGVILIGVHDRLGSLEGLSEQQHATFDQTKFNNFLHKYTDPHHTANVHRIEVDGKRLVAIVIPEFADIPILCARDANSSSNPSKLILRKAALYKRTDKASSEPLEDADEMRELLNRALLRRQDDLLRAIRQIVQPTEIAPTREAGEEFRAEVESAELYFSEIDGGSFVHQPNWIVQLQPENYVANRIPNASDLQRLVQESAISLRGWTFPIIGRVSDSTWENFDGGSQSFYNSQSHAPEALRAYKSGLILWRSGMLEDYWQAFRGQNVISFIGIIYATTEWVLFAKRFFENILQVEENVVITVQALDIRGRSLVSADDRVPFFTNVYRTAESKFKIKEIISVSDLRSAPERSALKFAKKIFELFNWNDPNETMISNWQQRLIQRRF